jgi:hypothetical protein
MRDEIRRKYNELGHGKVTRKKPVNFPEIDDAVYNWYKKMKLRNPPVKWNGRLLKNRAQYTAKKLNLGNFQADTAWLKCFKKRHDINFRLEKQNVPTNQFDSLDQNINLSNVNEFLADLGNSEIKLQGEYFNNYSKDEDQDSFIFEEENEQNQEDFSDSTDCEEIEANDFEYTPSNKRTFSFSPLKNATRSQVNSQKSYQNCNNSMSNEDSRMNKRIVLNMLEKIQSYLETTTINTAVCVKHLCSLQMSIQNLPDD